MIKIIQNEKRGAIENMQLDASLLLEAKEGDPLILHLYCWQKPCLTYGYFIKIEDFLNVDRLQQRGIDFAKRPTGGGVIFHTWDVAFSVIVPTGHPLYRENTLECYQGINSIVKKAVAPFLALKTPTLLKCDPLNNKGHARHFCMAKPTIYDVMLGDKKIAGAAQRKKKNGLLHQGTISIESVDGALLSDVLIDAYTASLIEAGGNVMAGVDKRQVQEALILEFGRCV